MSILGSTSNHLPPTQAAGVDYARESLTISIVIVIIIITIIIIIIIIINITTLNVVDVVIIIIIMMSLCSSSSLYSSECFLWQKRKRKSDGKLKD